MVICEKIEKKGKNFHVVAFETMHIVHVLEQLVRGYMCGSNTNRWTNHLFSYKRKKNQKNVLTYFYRFEFQDRGTGYLHMLVWLKDITKIKLEAIRADIPWSNKLLAQQVLHLQPSDKPGVSFFQQETRVSSHKGRQLLQLFHPSEAFAKFLRAYVSTILPSLKCRMDIQTSDGKGMLLRYAASYVSKWHDAFNSDAMFSIRTGPYQAAYPYKNFSILFVFYTYFIAIIPILILFYFCQDLFYWYFLW